MMSEFVIALAMGRRIAASSQGMPRQEGKSAFLEDNPDAMTVLVPFPLARTVQRG